MSANKITSRNADTLDGQHAPTSAIVGVDSTQTLTNKTLTSPKINENVALTATATQLNTVGTGGVDTRLNSKIITATRNMTAASGDVSYTGVGFTPTSIDAIGDIQSTSNSFHGFSDSSKANHCVLHGGTDYKYNYATLIFIDTTWNALNTQSAIVKSYDADGFTLTWTKVGSPTGTIQLMFRCYR